MKKSYFIYLYFYPRAIRDFTSEQLSFVANIVRLYRGETIDNTYLENHPDEDNAGDWDIEKHFTNGYKDIAGLCKIATIAEIEEQGWSLAFVGKNLLDERIVAYTANQPLAFTTFGAPSRTANIAPPRTYGVQARINF